MKQENVNGLSQEQKQPQIVVNPKNNMGLTGFILSLVALFFGWIPVFGWIVWTLGVIFSTVGVFRSPKGLSIAGLAISLVGAIMMLAFFALIGVALTQ
jgi:hypothetical protein